MLAQWQVCLDLCGDLPQGEEGRPHLAAGLWLRLQVLLSCVGVSAQQQRQARRLDGHRVLHLKPPRPHLQTSARGICPGPFWERLLQAKLGFVTQQRHCQAQKPGGQGRVF